MEFLGQSVGQSKFCLHERSICRSHTVNHLHFNRVSFSLPQHTLEQACTGSHRRSICIDRLLISGCMVSALLCVCGISFFYYEAPNISDRNEPMAEGDEVNCLLTEVHSARLEARRGSVPDTSTAARVSKSSVYGGLRSLLPKLGHGSKLK